MTEQELYNEYRKSDCKSFTDFLINKITELKADNDARKFAMVMSEKVEKQLRNERNTFLAQNEQYEKDLIDFNENLTNAKEIIKGILEITEDCKMYKNIYKQAKQFLNSEVKKNDSK